MPAAVDRRDFLKQTGGLTLALALAPIVGAAAADSPQALTLWVGIATDGTVTVVSPPAELGQGTFTALAAVLADELDADWSKVKITHPPVWDEKTYGNPEFFNFLHTGGCVILTLDQSASSSSASTAASAVKVPCPSSAGGDTTVTVPSVAMPTQSVSACGLSAAAAPTIGASASASVRPPVCLRKSRRSTAAGMAGALPH